MIEEIYLCAAQGFTTDGPMILTDSYQNVNNAANGEWAGPQWGEAPPGDAFIEYRMFAPYKLILPTDRIIRLSIGSHQKSVNGPCQLTFNLIDFRTGKLGTPKSITIDGEWTGLVDNGTWGFDMTPEDFSTRPPFGWGWYGVRLQKSGAAHAVDSLSLTVYVERDEIKDAGDGREDAALSILCPVPADNYHLMPKGVEGSVYIGTGWIDAASERGGGINQNNIPVLFYTNVYRDPLTRFLVVATVIKLDSTEFTIDHMRQSGFLGFETLPVSGMKTPKLLKHDFCLMSPRLCTLMEYYDPEDTFAYACNYSINVWCSRVSDGLKFDYARGERHIRFRPFDKFENSVSVTGQPQPLTGPISIV